jgi:hypothetical protein
MLLATERRSGDLLVDEVGGPRVRKLKESSRRLITADVRNCERQGGLASTVTLHAHVFFMVSSESKNAVVRTAHNSAAVCQMSAGKVGCVQ